MEASKLKELQQIETEILQVVHDFCEDNGIKYSLYAGTALGAVRHKGFIPWDDDIDICMEREMYEKFLDLWNQQPISGYYLQDTRDNSTTINHSKVRKNNTILASHAELMTEGHHGIWIDIFPLDKVPKKRIGKIQTIAAAMIGMVYTRKYPITNKGKILEILSRMMLILPMNVQNKIKNKCDQSVIKHCRLKENYDLMSLSSPEALKIVFPKNMLDRLICVSFENKQFKLSAEYDMMLKCCYGDYMKLPPEEERICKHNPEVFEVNL